MNHHNSDYSGGFPEAVGDRFYAQDLFRDLWFNIDNAGKNIKEQYVDFPVLFNDAQVLQGSDFEHIDIEAISGLVNFEITIPDSFSSLPPTTKTEDVVVRVSLTQQTDLDISATATLDGSTTNYVKVRYAETSGNTRVRAKKSGTYTYEKIPSFTVTVNTTAPTDYDLVLAELVGDGSSFLTIVNKESSSLQEEKFSLVEDDITMSVNKKYIVKGNVNLTLPAAEVGDIIDLFIEDYAKILQSDGNEIISYKNIFNTAQGSSGYLQIFGKSKLSLVYKGLSSVRSEIITKLADPATLPGATGYSCDWSPDGIYLAIAHSVSPYIFIYKRSGDTFTKLADPSSLPAGTGNGCCFSPDGIYLAIAHPSSPYITIYKRSGDTFTKLADPSSLPVSTGNACSFSPNGLYLVVGQNNSPYIVIYKRSGDTFTKLADPSSLPAGTGRRSSWTDDSNYLSIAHNNSPYITIYKRNIDTFTKITDPSPLPSSTALDSSFSKDKKQLCVIYGSTRTIYDFSNDILTGLTNNFTYSWAISNSVKFSEDNKYLVFGVYNSPRVAVFKKIGSTYEKLADPSYIADNVTYDAKLSPDGNYLALTGVMTEGIILYKMTTDISKVWEVKNIEIVSDSLINNMFQ